MKWIEKKDGSILIRVKVTPRAKKESVGPAGGERLPVKLTAPPVEDKANKALIALFAKKLGAPKSSVSIKSGHKSREKTVLVQGITSDHAKKLLAEK